MTKQASWEIFTDGGAIGNPGPAAIGVVVKKNSQTVKKIAKYLGKTTNNVAEYMAVIEALEWLKTNGPWSGEKVFWLDSKLVVNQLNGFFKVKDYKLRNLIVKVRELEREVGGNIIYRHVRREKNQEADALVKSVLVKR